jgi:uncharacterized membrane protein YphA (DoxX/SURF4 family)
MAIQFTRQQVIPTVGLFNRLILAFVLLYAGGVKIFEQHGARDAILAYRLFPVSWASTLGYALPLLEIALGLLLLVGLFTRLSALITALLMLGFVGGIASVWARGYSIDCGCFGGGGDISPEGRASRYTQEILRDLLFAGMGFWLVQWPRTRLSLESSNIGDTYTTDEMQD